MEKNEENKENRKSRCCCCDDRKSLSDSEEKKIINETTRMEDDSLNSTIDVEKKKDDLNEYFFSLSNKKYTDEELLNMDIYEINIGFHPTKIPNDGSISFHPFFYLKLNNEDEIGLVIQYTKLNPEKSEKTHMYEGIEYLEKNYKIFEAELINIFKKIKVNFMASKYLIPYYIANMNLRDFFQKIMPVQGMWTQNSFNIKNHACIHFCVDALKKLQLKGKKPEIIAEYKKYIFKVIEYGKQSKYYKYYKNGFEQLFNLIK